MIKELSNNKEIWDIVIVGGGATGLGAAVDAASRGLRTLLIEQHDFAKGTSSRSTKLIHGGLRYLQQGNVSLVLEALRERGRLCLNAPHLIYHRAFFVPSYHWWEGPFYGIGLKIYDILAGKLGLEPSRHLTLEETLDALPTLEPKGLRGGTVYYDGQFDDARLAITLAQTAVDHGACVVNYVEATELIKNDGFIHGVKIHDKVGDKTYTIQSKVVINATGVFSDKLRKQDEPESTPIIQPSQGIHIVLDKSFLDSETAILVPHTDDGRVLFMVPWYHRVLVGTTDTPVAKPLLEPEPLESEIDFLLKHTSKYLSKVPSRKDILSIFAGLRPLVLEGDGKKTASISRDHSISVSSSGLITIAGGKWTTYRKMAEDVIDQALKMCHIEGRKCVTEKLKLHGWKRDVDPASPWSQYGSDSKHLQAMIDASPELGNPLAPELPYTPAEILWAVKHEMALTLEDVLARRTRALLLDAKAAMRIAPEVAALMAKELSKTETWVEEQVSSFIDLAKRYAV